jgi:hypothetical protein
LTDAAARKVTNAIEVSKITLLSLDRGTSFLYDFDDRHDLVRMPRGHREQKAIIGVRGIFGQTGF